MSEEQTFAERQAEEEAKFALLTSWHESIAPMQAAKAKEAKLRKQVIEAFFPDGLKEGTNRAELPHEKDLVASQPHTRNIDEGAFNSIKEKLVELETPVDMLVVSKLSLAKTIYNKLGEKQLALFNECIIEKPGSASLEIATAKKKK